MSLTQDQVVEYVKNISVLECSQLVKRLEQELGVSAAAAAPVAVAGGGGAAAAAVEEKTEFTVTLTDVGANKDLVEAAPKPVKEAVNKDEAATIKKKFEEVGAKVEVK